MTIKISTKGITFTPSWNDNKSSNKPITILLGRLTLEDYWRVSSLCVALGDMNKIEAKNRAADFADIAKELSPIFSRYVGEIKNLTVDDAPAKSSDLTKTAQLLPLVFEVLPELLTISTLDEGLKKKLKESSQDDNPQT